MNEGFVEFEPQPRSTSFGLLVPLRPKHGWGKMRVAKSLVLASLRDAFETRKLWVMEGRGVAQSPATGRDGTAIYRMRSFANPEWTSESSSMRECKDCPRGLAA